MHDVLWLKFGLQCSGIVWRHYYQHNLIMALYILCLWLCRYCTSAQPTVWGGTLADSSAWVPPIALNPIHEILDRGGGENNHTTALNVVHVTEKDDQVMTDHTGSYFMPIPPFFLLYTERERDRECHGNQNGCNGQWCLRMSQLIPLLPVSAP